MVVIITPYLVGTAARQDLRLPGEAAAPEAAGTVAAAAGLQGGAKDFGFIIE
jgi:hypothetical protein